MWQIDWKGLGSKTFVSVLCWITSSYIDIGNKVLNTLQDHFLLGHTQGIKPRNQVNCIMVPIFMLIALQEAEINSEKVLEKYE